MSEPYAYGMWPVALFNTGIFVLFVFSFLKPRMRREWRSMGTYIAFVVALFTEMYGFPLTIYILTSVLGSKYPVTNAFTHMSGNLWAAFAGGSEALSALLMTLGGIIMLAGLIIMGTAWKQIHRANGELVTSGLYRRVRHPQYFGLLLITLGMLIQWPTMIIAVMWPILMLIYYRLARKEELEMGSLFGDEYTAYKRGVPMFLPRIPGFQGTKAEAPTLR